MHAMQSISRVIAMTASRRCTPRRCCFSLFDLGCNARHAVHISCSPASKHYRPRKPGYVFFDVRVPNAARRGRLSRRKIAVAVRDAGDAYLVPEPTHREHHVPRTPCSRCSWLEGTRADVSFEVVPTPHPRHVFTPRVLREVVRARHVGVDEIVNTFDEGRTHAVQLGYLAQGED